MKTLIPGGAQSCRVSFPLRGSTDCTVSGTGPKHCFTISSSCHCHFWWLLLLCCLNRSSASADKSELPKALRHQQDHQFCHLTQHRHSHSPFLPGQTHVHILLPLLLWLQGHRTPSHHQGPGQTTVTITPLQASHSNLHLLTKRGLPPVSEFFVWPTTILTKDLLFKKGLGASLSAAVYQFDSLLNLFKKENRGLGPSKKR